MLLVDVNLLIHAVNRDSPDHAKARAWWLELEQAGQIVGLSWMTLVAFVRLSTNAKVLTKPLPLADALDAMHRLLAQPNVLIVQPGANHAAEFDRACRAVQALSHLVTDAHLAALAFEHGCELASCDTDFGKFPNLRRANPLVF